MPVIPVVPDQLAETASYYVEDETAFEPEPSAMPVVPLVPDQLVGEESDDLQQETVVDEIDASEENFSDEQDDPEWRAADHGFDRPRRRRKLIRFIIFETLVIAVVLVAAKLAVMERYSENSLSALYATIVVIAAIAAAIIPVLFFALPPTLPGDR
jgi:uncharacterized membrane protein YcjF (UPF0283 family)